MMLLSKHSRVPFCGITDLRLYKPDKPFYLRCDASDVAVGAALEQYDPVTGKSFAFCFWSRKRTGTQKKWTPREKEAYAIVSALRKYETWIGNNPVSVITDHKSLDGWLSVQLDTPSGPRGRRGRWHKTFSKFNLSVLYVPGKDNELADILSRWAYPAYQAWQDVSTHGSAQGKLEHKTLLAEEKKNEATRVYSVLANGYTPISGCPELADHLVALPPPTMVSESSCHTCQGFSVVALQCNPCFIHALFMRHHKRVIDTAVATALAASAVMAAVVAAQGKIPQGTQPAPSTSASGAHQAEPSLVSTSVSVQTDPFLGSSTTFESARQAAAAIVAAAHAATAYAVSNAAMPIPRPPVHIRDTLPPSPYPELSPEVLWDPWDKYYESDKRFQGICRACKNNTALRQNYPEYRLKNGRLFYKAYCVVPEDLHVPVIQAWHNENVYARSAALYAGLRRRFWIEPNMSQKCKQVSRHCPICQAVQPPSQSKEGLLLPHPVPDRVMSSVSLDTFYIGLAKDESGPLLDSVAICVCRLSGAMICEPVLLEGLTGAKVGKPWIKHWLSVYDVPVEIDTDHDPKFISAWFQTLCSGLGITIAYSDVQRSKTNGRAEVVGHQVLDILRKVHAASDPKDDNTSWVRHIVSVVRGHFQKPGHFGLSPQQIVFGREKIGPGPCMPPQREAPCATQWLHQMCDMVRLVQSLQEQQLKQYAVRYNKTRQESTEYFPGDLVWVCMQRPMGTSKLDPFWVGPCEVTSRKGRNTYVVRTDDSTEKKNTSPS